MLLDIICVKKMSFYQINATEQIYSDVIQNALFQNILETNYINIYSLNYIMTYYYLDRYIGVSMAHVLFHFSQQSKCFPISLRPTGQMFSTFIAVILAHVYLFPFTDKNITCCFQWNVTQV